LVPKETKFIRKDFVGLKRDKSGSKGDKINRERLCRFKRRPMETKDFE